MEQTVAKTGPDPKAVASYGLLSHPDVAGAGAAEALWLRFFDGRPVSAITTQFLEWCCARLAVAGIATLVLVWDNASWHVSGAVRTWLRTHNQCAHREGGVRIIPRFLPTKRPWRNPIEPQWVNGKRLVVEPARLLTARELEERVCAACDWPLCDHLAIPQEVARSCARTRIVPW